MERTDEIKVLIERFGIPDKSSFCWTHRSNELGDLKAIIFFDGSWLVYIDEDSQPYRVPIDDFFKTNTALE